MKKNVILSIVGVLLILGIGISFAYYVSQVLISGDGSDVSVTPGDMIKVTYDAGSGTLNTEGMVPGDIATKNFTVTVTPTEKEKEATYSIILNIAENTFVKCDDSNYNDITNACERDADELVYRLKDSDNQVIAEGTLMGVTGEIKLITETKIVDVQTTYNYTLEIEFIETGYDQNHNQNKVLNGSVEVEFDELVGSEYILSHYDTVLTRDDFSTTVEETTTGTIYKSLDETQYDNDGEVYYFAGNPTDNWVKFAGFYWRIIRINGDGSVRLIYNGTDISKNLDMSFDDHIGTSAFNFTYNDNTYVGYMMGLSNECSSGYCQGNSHTSSYSQATSNMYNSTIKTVLDNWYVQELLQYNEIISKDTGFCGDRVLQENVSTSQSGYGIQNALYGAYDRLFYNEVPIFKCQKNDLYTISGSNKGNSALIYPIGLISLDEARYAGGAFSTKNDRFYLYSDSPYWTMSPFYFNGGAAFVFSISSGNFGGEIVHAVWNVRPVINLKADVQLSGSGTADDPYIVVGAE